MMELFSLRTADLVPGSLILLPVSVLETSPYQMREDYGAIEELSLSIAENGQQNPIRVWFSSAAEGTVVVGREKFRVFVHDGNRRVTAIGLAQDKGWIDKDFLVRAVVIPEFSHPADALVSQFTLNNTGLGFSRLETARLVKKLTDSGLTQQEIAKRLGKSQSWVSNQLKIINAGSEILSKIEREEISLSKALRSLQRKHRKQNNSQLAPPKIEGTVNLQDWEQISQLGLEDVAILLIENSHSLEAVGDWELRVTVNKLLFNRLEELIL